MKISFKMIGGSDLNRYEGAVCPVCGQAFTQGDDVVVCPACGTPHHRACWMREGRCANEKKHASGYTWQGAPQEKNAFEEKTELGIICPRCGTNSPRDTLFCPNCGQPLGAQQPGGYSPFGGQPYAQRFVTNVPPDEKIDGIPVAEVAAYVRTGTVSYLSKFFRMDREKKKIGWNWAAFFFSPFWFFYRKLYAAGAVVTSLLLALSVAFSGPLEQYMERMRKKVKEGYSIAIFPEGTRTYNGKMKRFHKGAFYLAEALKLDILPILLYGNNKIIAKAQPFNIRKGIIYTEILPRIPLDDLSFGSTYQERTKRISAYMKEVYARICREQNTTNNPAFYEALIQNYIYKGPVIEWYIRIKVKMEKNYRLFNRLIPVQGQITDIGCGFGPLCYMLSLLSEDREILGIDYDEDKIGLAQHGWLRNEHLQFKHGNALEYPLPESDVFILNDMLHYMSYEHQQTLLLKCAGRLRSQGMIIIRDGNSANASKHRLTRFTELLSTRIFNFNRTTGELYFTTETQLREIAVTCGMAVEIIPNDKYTSNTIYIFRKPN